MYVCMYVCMYDTTFIDRQVLSKMHGDVKSHSPRQETLSQLYSATILSPAIAPVKYAMACVCALIKLQSANTGQF